MEAAVVSVGKAVMNSLLSGAKATITQDAALTQSIQRDLLFLTEELAAMHIFMEAMDLEENKHKVPRAKVKEIRQLSYDVEDCLQDHAVHLEMISWRCLPRTLLQRHRIAQEMKGLRARMDDMRNRNLPYHHVEDYLSSKPKHTSHSGAEIFSTDEARSFKMQETAKDKLLRLIKYKMGLNLGVIAVWGPSGQTSILESTYDDCRRYMEFECHACIKVMPPVKPTELLQSIIRQLYIHSLEKDRRVQEKPFPWAQVLRRMGTTEEHDLANEFKEYVKDKSYLIVLNGLSTIQEWDRIKAYFPTNKKRSRILVSAEQVEVASLCGGLENLMPELKQLSTDPTLYAFYNEVDYESVGLDSTKMKSETKSSMSICTAGNSKAVHLDKIQEEDDSEGLAGSSSPCPLLNEDSNTAAVKKLTSSMTMIGAEDVELFGREHDKKLVIGLLSDGNPHREVVSLWGEGGVGKTALVRSIYQSSELGTPNFEKRAWVYVLRPFQPAEVLRRLAQQLVQYSTIKKGESTPGIARNDLSTMGTKELSNKLNQDLTDKKYLIVLDDLSSTTEWDFIIRNLPPNNNGSRIIVTTRPKGVARHCSKMEDYMHNIQGLTNVDAIQLFIKKVFKESDKSGLEPSAKDFEKENPDMTEVAKIIINKYSGVPLSIATAGAFLSTRPKNITEWRKFSKILDKDAFLEKIKTICISSYEGLPYHLKSCFLYLSIFPEDHNIRHGRLLRRWIAEGYSTRNKNVGKEAEEQFKALLNKSIIQQSRTVTGNSRKTGFCQVHNLMREISVSKSEEENLVLVLDDDSTSHSKDKVRHLVVSQSWSNDKKKNDLQRIVDVSHIRSLTVFGDWRSYFISKKMRMIRVLDLEDAKGLQDHDLVPIGKLRHLKYLSLRGSIGIFNLPGSFGNLLNLETLDIRGTYVSKLPATICMLQNLKYLRAGMPEDDSEDDTRSNPLILTIVNIFHGYLSQEGVGMRSIVPFILWFISCWLRNLDLCGVKVPKGIGRWRAMHTLSVVNIARGKAMLKNLNKLTQLRKLGVTGIDKNNCKELCAAIVDHSRLQSLLLRAEGKVGLVGCLDDLSPPPKDLESLKLYGNLVTLPNWIEQLENLQKLCLRSTNLDMGATIKVLGELRMLSILRLQDETFKEDELCFPPKCFPSLTVLELVSWYNLKSVKFEAEATPKLEELRVDHCWQLQKHNGFSGIENLASLKEKFLKELKEQLQEQLGENTNRPNLKIL